MRRTSVVSVLAIAAVCALIWSPWVGGESADPAPAVPLPKNTSIEQFVDDAATTAASPTTSPAGQGAESTITSTASVGTTAPIGPSTTLAVDTAATGAAPSTTSVPPEIAAVVTTTAPAQAPAGQPQPAEPGTSDPIAAGQFPDDDAGAGGGSGIAVPGAVTPPTFEMPEEDTSAADEEARAAQEQEDREQEERDRAEEAANAAID